MLKKLFDLYRKMQRGGVYRQKDTCINRIRNMYIPKFKQINIIKFFYFKSDGICIRLLLYEILEIIIQSLYLVHISE